MIKFCSLLLTMLIIPCIAVGRMVSLQVVCKDSRVPLQASVRLEYNDSEAISVLCDKSGKASIEYPDSVTDAILEISSEGRIPLVVSLPPDKILKLGTIELERETIALRELTVYGNNSTVRAGKRSLIPSTQKVARNYSTIQLLSDMQSMAPELQVNSFLHTVTIDGQQPVFQINGRVQKMDRLIDLRPEQIARIEMTTYRDLQYDAPVFNIILKPASKGGSVSLYTQDAVTTPKAYAKATGTFNYKKSEFLFDYKYVYRNSSKEMANENEAYIAPDFSVLRYGNGLPSSTIDQDHRFLLEYTLMPDKYSVFVLSGEATIHRNRNSEGTSFYQKNGIDGEETSFDSWNRRHYLRTPFSVGVYYRYSKDKHKFELSSSLSHSSSDYGRELEYSDGYNLGSISHNSGLSSGTDATYSMQLPSNLSLDFGAQYTYRSSSSDFVQDGSPESKTDLHSHDVYVFGKIGWFNRGFSIVGGPGIRYYSSYNGQTNDSFVRWRGVVSASQNISRAISGSYTFSIDPQFPSLANSTTVVQRLNDFSVQTGNPDLKSSLTMSHNLRLNLRIKKLRISPYAIYTYIRNPMLESWSYSPEEIYFVRSTENGEYSHNLTAAVNLSLSNLIDKINLSANVGYNRFWVDMCDGEESRGHLFLDLNASAYFGPVNIGFKIAPVRGLQYQGYTYSRSTTFNSVSCNYRYRDFQFGITWQNPLTDKAFLSETYSLSKVHPRYREYYIEDFNNMILLSLQYRFGIGDVYKKPNISTNKISTSDIIIAY